MPHQPHRLIPASFAPGPSLDLRTRVEITPDFGQGATIAGYAVSSDGPVPAAIGLDRAALTEAGFTGAVGQALVLPRHPHRPSSPSASARRVCSRPRP
ncbi:hypothetical protein [Cryobacterium sp. 10C3]|uniref:hypothetical protein n=1 Tax=Cryobacterium sp. 10C3 TaxID=3048577 RepID=UPI002AB51EF8|nr:hypothetical protein [Cryobacterium sp. 10C3]MDY7556812.1 hypothetical protein [Cryobacterium sp. 10C3]